MSGLVTVLKPDAMVGSRSRTKCYIDRQTTANRLPGLHRLAPFN